LFFLDESALDNSFAPNSQPSSLPTGEVAAQAPAHHTPGCLRHPPNTISCSLPSRVGAPGPRPVGQRRGGGRRAMQKPKGEGQLAGKRPGANSALGCRLGIRSASDGRGAGSLSRKAPPPPGGSAGFWERGVAQVPITKGSSGGGDFKVPIMQGPPSPVGRPAMGPGDGAGAGGAGGGRLGPRRHPLGDAHRHPPRRCPTWAPPARAGGGRTGAGRGGVSNTWDEHTVFSPFDLPFHTSTISNSNKSISPDFPCPDIFLFPNWRFFHLPPTMTNLGPLAWLVGCVPCREISVTY